MSELDEIGDDDLIQIENHHVDEWWRDRNGHVTHVTEVTRYELRDVVTGETDADTVLYGTRVRCPDACPVNNDHWGMFCIFCRYENWRQGETIHLVRIDVRGSDE